MVTICRAPPIAASAHLRRRAPRASGSRRLQERAPPLQPCGQACHSRGRAAAANLAWSLSRVPAGDDANPFIDRLHRVGCWPGKGNLVTSHSFPLKSNLIIGPVSYTKLTLNYSVYWQGQGFLVSYSKRNVFTVFPSQFSLLYFNLMKGARVGGL